MLEDLEYTGRNVVAVGKDPHLQGSVGSAGEDPVTWTGFDLHHPSADVSEYGLFSVLGAEGVHETVTRELPDLNQNRNIIISSDVTKYNNNFLLKHLN